MEVNRHIGFSITKNKDMFNYIVSQNIPFKQINNDSCVFDIYESDPHFAHIAPHLGNGGIVCLSNTLFTKKELEEAKWLTMRSAWRCGYPQPEDGIGYEEITYTKQDFCKVCGAGLRQVADFRIKKTPKWGKRHFMMLNWVGDEIFLDDIARVLLKKNNLSGFVFQDVRDKKGIQIQPDIMQLVIPNLLPEGLVTDRRSIDQINKCPCCGVTKYHPTGIERVAFREGVFQNAPDIVKTDEVFGWEHWTEKLIIISQRMYKTLTENHLANSLEFEPIELV